MPPTLSDTIINSSFLPIFDTFDFDSIPVDSRHLKYPYSVVPQTISGKENYRGTGGKWSKMHVQTSN